MDDKRKAILDRLVKLEALANSDPTQFQNEVSVASAKIAEIMDKYAISWAEVQAAKGEAEQKAFQEDFKDTYADYTSRRVKVWHGQLAMIIANATNTKCFRAGTRMVFFGLESSGSFANEMFSEWLGTLDRMSLKYQHEFVRHNGRSYESRYYRSSWISGCLSQMRENVRKSKEQARSTIDSNSTALVLFDRNLVQRFTNAHPDLRTHYSRGSSGFSSSGYRDGKQAGSGFNIGSRKIGASHLLTG